MAGTDPTGITSLLKAWAGGDEKALDELTPLVYGQLHVLARRLMHRERPGGPLQPTALVHEVYLRLVDLNEVDWHDRVHFFALAARLMRRILVDAARARNAAKRGGGAVMVEQGLGPDLDGIPSADWSASRICALNDALDSLTKLDPRQARVIELRFFGGLSVEEAAEALHVSPQTVMRDWRLARLWLERELRGESAPS